MDNVFVKMDTKEIINKIVFLYVEIIKFWEIINVNVLMIIREILLINVFLFQNVVKIKFL